MSHPRAVQLWAAVAGAAYAVALFAGTSLTLPVALAAAVLMFRACFRAGHRLAPFATVLVVLALQNVAAGALGRAHAAHSFQIAITFSALLPAAVLAGGWLCEPARARRWLRFGLGGDQLFVVVVALAAIVVTLARWVTGPIPLSLALPSVRNALTPAYGVLVVLLLPPVLRPSTDDLGRWLARWGLVVAVFGFFEWAVLRDWFWATIAHIGGAISVKHLSIAHVRAYRVPADFYTVIGHHYFRRLVSVYGDAVTTSYYLALAILAAVVLSRRRTLAVQLAVLVPALVLGAVKGAVGVVLVGLVVIAFVSSPLRRYARSGAAVVLIACASCVLIANATRFLPVNSSADLHVDGLRTAVASATEHGSSLLWGNGMATGGSGAAYVKRAGADGATARAVPGLDNGAGTILVQTGVLGLVLVLGQFALVIGACLRRAREHRGALLAASAVAALLVNFLLQEHSLTLATSLPFWLLGAVAMTQQLRAEVPLPATTASGAHDVVAIPDDPELLALMLDDFRAADVEHELAGARLAYVESLMTELRAREDVRRCHAPECTSCQSDRAHRLRVELSAIDLQVALLACHMKAASLPHLVSVDKLDISRVGDPAGYDNSGRFLTRQALVGYMHCAYVSGFVDLSRIDVLVQLGCTHGEHTEVLHQLYPNLTIAVLDVPPNLYAAEQYLRAAYPADTVSYRRNRGVHPPRLERGKIHFLGISRLRELEPAPRTLFWHAVGAGAAPFESVDDYGWTVSGLADWLYLTQAFDARDVCAVREAHWEHHRGALSQFTLTDRRVGPSYFDRDARLDDSFWSRIGT